MIKYKTQSFDPLSVELVQLVCVESFQPSPITLLLPNYMAERTTHGTTQPTAVCSPCRRKDRGLFKTSKGDIDSILKSLPTQDTPSLHHSHHSKTINR